MRGSFVFEMLRIAKFAGRVPFFFRLWQTVFTAKIIVCGERRRRSLKGRASPEFVARKHRCSADHDGPRPGAEGYRPFLERAPEKDLSISGNLFRSHGRAGRPDPLGRHDGGPTPCGHGWPPLVAGRSAHPRAAPIRQSL